MLFPNRETGVCVDTGWGVMDLWWIFYIISGIALLIVIETAFSRRRLMKARRRMLTRVRRKLKGRVIALIHREEVVRTLGIPLTRHIDMDDAEAILRAIRETPKDRPIHLILHTPGGLVLAALQIARALHAHSGKVTVYVPHFAMSGGTLIALAADQIVMARHAVLGPVDPQIGGVPASAILKVVETKEPNDTSDTTIMFADIARKATDQLEEAVTELLTPRFSHNAATTLAHRLTHGEWTHDYAITADKATELGLAVSTKIPGEIIELLSFYPQPVGRRSGVDTIGKAPLVPTENPIWDQRITY